MGKEKQLPVAEFIDNQLDGKAWFDATGRWYMTETELTHTSQLPEDVQKALANSEYAQWYIDDIDRLERNETETIYVIEVKKDKTRIRSLLFSRRNFGQSSGRPNR